MLLKLTSMPWAMGMAPLAHHFSCDIPGWPLLDIGPSLFAFESRRDQPMCKFYLAYAPKTRPLQSEQELMTEFLMSGEVQNNFFLAWTIVHNLLLCFVWRSGSFLL